MAVLHCLLVHIAVFVVVQLYSLQKYSYQKMFVINHLFKPLSGLQLALEDISKGDGNLTV